MAERGIRVRGGLGRECKVEESVVDFLSPSRSQYRTAKIARVTR